MPLAVDVWIWGWEGIGVTVGAWQGRVGHVMVTPSDSTTVLLSQFPHALGLPTSIEGPNTRLSFQDTRTAEQSDVSVVYGVTVPDGDVFMSMVNNEVARPIWSWDPEPPTQTHCARAAYDALKAGGVPIDPANDYVIANGEHNEILPDTVWSLLSDALGDQAIKRPTTASLFAAPLGGRPLKPGKTQMLSRELRLQYENQIGEYMKARRRAGTP